MANPLQELRHGKKIIRKSTIVASLAILLSLSLLSYAQQSSSTGNSTYYVSATASPNGDGTRNRPFNLLSQAASASSVGDTIYLIANDQNTPLDGGIALKSGQKLMAMGADAQALENAVARVLITNTTINLDGVIVQLSDHNEVAGLHFVNMKNSAISSSAENYTGTYIHHSTFTGNASEHEEDERGLVYAISLNGREGDLDGIRIEDCDFRDGADLGGIRVFQSGNSKGNYRFQRNQFSDLGGRAYFIQSRNSSVIETAILDSRVDNIGRGERNSDSIIPYLMGQSEQVMLVRNYHFKNTQHQGNQSNTAIEAFIFGEPRPEESNWCTSCKLTLKIIDSVFENSVTDPIQFTNFGRNSRLIYEIRNSRIINGNPRQGGGAISLNLQSVANSGSSTTLLVEGTDIIGSTGYGFTLNNRGGGNEGYTVIVDFGGGALGSLGNNRFIDNERGEMRVPLQRITAMNNWWGGKTPVIYNADNELFEDSKVEIAPLLSIDPRE